MNGLGGETPAKTTLGDVAESAIAKWLVRLLMGICGFLAYDKLQSVNESVEQVVAKQEEAVNAQSDFKVKLTEINGKVDRLDTKMDSAVVYQINDLRKRVDRLEADPQPRRNP